jgi:hypothetical protein
MSVTSLLSGYRCGRSLPAQTVDVYSSAVLTTTRKEIGNLKVCKALLPTRYIFIAEIFDIKQYCGFGMFITDPGSEFFHPGSQIQGLKDTGSG